MNGVDEPRYTSKVNGRWFADMLGGVDTTGSTEFYTGIFGYPMTAVTIDGVKRYRVATENNGWLAWTAGYNRDDPAGDGSRIIGIDIDDPTVEYMIHIKGGSWTKNTKQCMLPIDGLQILRLDSKEVSDGET